MNLVTKPSSITHLHILSILVTEIRKRDLDYCCLRILDAGCGNGHLLCFLNLNLPNFFPNIIFEIYGYDVGNHGVQAKEFFSKTLEYCSQKLPEVEWGKRLNLIGAQEDWPFESNTFDFVYSNQVLEHVSDHRHFFSENHRTLKDDGCGVHLFPLKHYIYEGHLFIPFVHRISDWGALKSYIKIMSWFGIGKYHKNRMDLDVYSERHADYMTHYTNYVTHSELFGIVKPSKLRPSLKYTPDFYAHKLRQILRRKEVFDLSSRLNFTLFNWFLSHLLKYISSVTLFVEKKNTYSYE